MTNTSTDSLCPDCIPFVNWQYHYPDPKHDKPVFFRSLVATLQLKPGLDVSLEAKAVEVLKYVVPSNEKSADAFLRSIASPLFLSFSEGVDIHTNIMKIIQYSYWLATPDGIEYLEVSDPSARQAVRETVLKQILEPSEEYICHLCVNHSSIVDGKQSIYFLELLAHLLELSPINRALPAVLDTSERRTNRNDASSTQPLPRASPTRKGMRQKAGSATPTHMRNDMSSEEAVERGMEKQDEMALHTLSGRAMSKMLTVHARISHSFINRTVEMWDTAERKANSSGFSAECLDMERKGGEQDMDVLSRGLESWLCVLIRSEYCRLGDCGVKGRRGIDGHNDTLRQSPSSRHAVRTLWRSVASGLADLEIKDRSDNSEWIRQRSFEFSASRFATLRVLIFNTARRSYRFRSPLLHSSIH
ncbi:hypothetical protein BLNAU_16332 [Blattamonas nauphoetae]|uniref:Uncharacterized protein n=1 Tax=Blattamonas nauphoetae TaxID=2049346 RepID=A0ABQ9XAH8_9EUKA|nr:hypothetical protein BLNAU_16332 [Blattamonas nauphoetae]